MGIQRNSQNPKYGQPGEWPTIKVESVTISDMIKELEGIRAEYGELSIVRRYASVDDDGSVETVRDAIWRRVDEHAKPEDRNPDHYFFDIDTAGDRHSYWDIEGLPTGTPILVVES